MALTPGTHLGVYEVTALLGEGGMGQVWQATDTQLDQVARLGASLHGSAFVTTQPQAWWPRSPETSRSGRAGSA